MTPRVRVPFQTYLMMLNERIAAREAAAVATTSEASHPKTETSAADLPLSQHGDDNR